MLIFVWSIFWWYGITDSYLYLWDISQNLIWYSKLSRNEIFAIIVAVYDISAIFITLFLNYYVRYLVNDKFNKTK